MCLMMVEWLFLEVPLGCLRFVNVVFPDHTHLIRISKRNFRMVISLLLIFLYCGASLCGTDQYWIQRSQELQIFDSISDQ